jgi:NAD+ synthase (glutamine-hydrolysing)
MKITIGQINTTNGDYAGNVEQILRAIEQGKRDGAALVVTPEVAVQGYTSLDWFMDKDVARDCLQPLQAVIEATQGITAVVGTARPNESGLGRRLFNSAAVIQDGKLLGFVDKALLPEYDVFDDPRYFEPNREPRRLFDVDGVKMGVVICEDFWNDKTYWRERLYANDPVDEVIALGAELIVAINASPFNRGKSGLRCEMVAHRAKATGVPVVFVNLVGGNDGIIFDGASLISDAEGDIIYQAPAFEEFFGTVELDNAKPDIFAELIKEVANQQESGEAEKAAANVHSLTVVETVTDHAAQLSLINARKLVDEVQLGDTLMFPRGLELSRMLAQAVGDDIETVRKALVLGVRDYARKNRFTRAILGLSGGIDSAVVAAIACEALGAENVLGVMMPSPFSSAGSVDDSVKMSQLTGMPVIKQPISEAFEVLVKQLNLHKPTKSGDALAAENLQSRLRGNILMTISNAEGRLVLATGNKSELSMGYCTLYGDTNGGLAVLGDLIKGEVYDLARHYNRAGEVIPWEIINKRPSAELAPNQFDDQSLPPYPKMDPVIEMYYEQKATPEEIIAAGHDAELVYNVLNRLESPANEFKRRQLPPTLIISKNAIGIGRRRPVTHKYKRTMPTP